jgi:uncharacterized protein
MASEVVVTALAVTPVKATRLHSVERVELDPAGARGNRRFFLIDERGRMVNAKGVGELTQLVADYDEVENRLSLAFPDGRVVSAAVDLGEEVSARFFSGDVAARIVEGPWSDALSDHVGRALRLALPADGGVDRGRRGGVSVISRASLGRLAELADEPAVDPRRFRMLIEIDGIGAHEEDRWVGATARIGSAAVRFHGHVGRCLITSRHPETGEVDLPTLDLLGSYRRGLGTTEPLPFGIYGEVVQEGAVSVGDVVKLGSASDE